MTLSLKGTVLLANATTLKIKVATATVFPVGITLLGLRKPMVLTMTEGALVGRASLRAGKTAIVLTQPAKTTSRRRPPTTAPSPSPGSSLRAG